MGLIHVKKKSTCTGKCLTQPDSDNTVAMYIFTDLQITIMDADTVMNAVLKCLSCPFQEKQKCFNSITRNLSSLTD